MKPIRIVITDDHVYMREGLSVVLAELEDIEIVGLAVDGLDAYEQASLLRPDLIIMDIQMPKLNGIESMKRIKSDFPEILVLILTNFIEDDYIVEAMLEGANGYLSKDISSVKIISAIQDVVSGDFILPAAIAAKLTQRLIKVQTESNETVVFRLAKLTEREIEIAEYIRQGVSNNSIAALLFLEEGTIRNSISSIYKKLNVKNREEAIQKLNGMR